MSVWLLFHVTFSFTSPPIRLNAEFGAKVYSVPMRLEIVSRISFFFNSCNILVFF